MGRVGHFSDKLGLVMRALSFSRVALAQDLAIDKSLVGRWLSGAVHPTEHNLVRLTELVSVRKPDFRLADWFGPLDEFAARFGLPEPLPANPASQTVDGVLGPFLDRSREETARRGSAYEGFWRTARPSLLMTNQLFHDYGMFRRTSSGLLEVRMRGAGLNFSGLMLPGEGNLFVLLQDPVGMTPMFLVLKGVALPRAMVLDGLLLIAALDAVRTPGAMPIILERVGDLSHDPAADDAFCESMEDVAPEPLEPLGEEALHQRIFRVGNPGALTVDVQGSHSRGTTSKGLSG
jgi:hypothetical protein